MASQSLHRLLAHLLYKMHLKHPLGAAGTADDDGDDGAQYQNSSLDFMILFGVRKYFSSVQFAYFQRLGLQAAAASM